MKVIFIVFIDFGYPKPSVKIVWVYFSRFFLNPLKDLYMTVKYFVHIINF